MRRLNTRRESDVLVKERDLVCSLRQEACRDTVVGFKRIDYTSRSGKQVHGCEIYLMPVEPDEGVNGIQCEAIYLNDSFAAYKPQIDQVVSKLYNQYGNVSDLQVISDG